MSCQVADRLKRVCALCFVWLVAVTIGLLLPSVACADKPTPPKKSELPAKTESPKKSGDREGQKSSKPTAPRKPVPKTSPLKGKSTPKKPGPEVRSKIKEVLEKKADSPTHAGHPGSSKRSSPARPSSKSSSGEDRETGGDSKKKINPADKAAKELLGGKSGPDDTWDSDVPPEERTYGFSIKDGTYQQLVDGFARQTGLGVIGETPDGDVTFVTTEELSFEAALSRIRMLLFNYKPHEPYWLLHEGSYLRAIRVTDIYRVLPREQMFASVEEFTGTGLPNDELALVVFRPKAGSVSDLEHIRDFMPDYVRIAPLEDANALTVFALVSDINKYLDLVEFFSAGLQKDPRPIVVIEIEHIAPSAAVAKLHTLMELDGNEERVSSRGSRSRGAKDAALEGIPEPAIDLLPDDTQGVLIVRAMQNKIDEIQMLLPYVDVDTSTGWEPVVIEVKHAEVEGLITTIRQILSAAEGSPIAAPATKPRKTRKTRKATKKAAVPATLSSVQAGDITLIPQPAANAVIVIASEDDVAYVRRLVDRFDVPQRIGPVLMELQHAEVQEAIPQLNQLLSAQSGGSTTASIVPDSSGNSIWVSGSKRDMERIEELLAAIDVPSEPTKWHIYMLINQRPSFVANMLRESDSERGDAMVPVKTSKKKGKKRSSPMVTASKFTADDATGRLYILCTDDEWNNQYLPIIEQLEAEDSRDRLVRIPVQNIEPNEAIARIQALVDVSIVRLVAADDGILISGGSEGQLDQINRVLAQIDVPTDLIQRTFEIQHAEPAQLVRVIETFVAGGKAPKVTRKSTSKGSKRMAAPVTTVSEGLTIMQVGNSLVVKATAEKMEEVAELIQQFDVEQDTTELRTYEFPPGANIDRIATTLSSVLGGRTGEGKTKRGSKSPVGGQAVTRFIPQPASHKLVVIAEESMFPKIEELLDVLREEDEGTTIEWAFIDVEYATPADIVEMIQPLLTFKIQRLIAEGELDESAVESAPGSKAQGKKQRSGGKRSSSLGLHIEADHRNQRIVIAAPQIVIDEARKLVSDFDVPDKDGEMVFKTVTLASADATEMVTTVSRLMNVSVQSRKSGKKVGKGRVGGQAAGDKSFTIVEAPGGGAVVLNGTASDITRAEVYIAELDGNTAGRRIKIYDVLGADLNQLAELILNVVDTPSTKKSPRRPSRPSRGAALEEDMWTTTKTFVGQEIYMQTDEIAGTLLVVASTAKLTRVDDIVEQFTFDEQGEPIVSPSLPTLVYPLKYADAFDASFNLDTLLDVVWEPKNKLPTVDYLTWDNTLIIKYPDKSRFPEIEDLIAKYVDKREEGPPVRKALPLPSSISAGDLVLLLKEKNPDLNFEIMEVKTPDTDDYGIEEVKPRARVSPCVLPLTASRAIGTMLVGVARQDDPDETEEDEQPATGTDGADGEPDNPNEPDGRQDKPGLDTIAARELIEREQADAEETADASVQSPDPDSPTSYFASGHRGLADETIKIIVDETTGALIVEGPKELVSDLESSIAEVVEELGKLPQRPDIRVIRVKHIDVNTAAGILDEMFNASKREQQAAQRRAEQLARQQRRQQQQAQRRQRDQQQRDQQGGRDTKQPAGQQQPQIQMPTAQIASGIQVLPNPADRTLIVRAATADFPIIYELLATIDQPQPFNYELRIIQLEKLNAAEVEEMLKEMLGLDSRQRAAPTSGRSRTSTRSRTSATTGKPLPHAIMQDTIAGELGVFKDDITLSSNPTANTILVMAPKAAIKLVEDMVQQLESHDVPERVTEHYKLKYADATEAAEYLGDYFAEQGAQGRRGRSRKGGMASPSLNAPTLLPYPRLNTLTVQATQEQVDQIGELIVGLDIAREGGEFEAVTLVSADAKQVADQLMTMFGGEARGRRGGGASGIAPKFIGAEGDSLLFFSAPTSMREEILATIQKIEQRQGEATKPRIIELEFATPTQVAEAIELAYGKQSRRGRRGGQSGRFQITGHDPSHRLFVIAPDDETFAEIESLAMTLDKPKKMDFDFQIYVLEHANARAVLETMNKLLTDYMRRVGRTGGKIEPFSVEVDDKANALIVLGGPAVFEFLKENLAKIDTPLNAAPKPGFLMVALTRANAAEVAQNITRLWSQRTLPPGQTPPQAEANRSLNMLIVRGTQEQIDEIKRDVIDPLEEHEPPAIKTETFTLQFAQPEAVADSINAIFQAKADAMKRLRGQGSVSPLEYTVIATPDVNTKQVVVQASEENMVIVTARIADLDKEEVAAAASMVMRSYPIKYADLNSVVRIITDWSRSRSTSGGRRRTVAARDMVSAVAEWGTQSVVVTASEANHITVKDMIDSVDDESLARSQRTFHTVVLQNADSVEVQEQLNAFFQRSKRSKRGDVGPYFQPDSKTNSILMSVNEEELTEAMVMLESLDVEAQIDTERSMKIHKIKFADPNGIVNAINATYRYDRRSRARPQDQVTAVIDWGTQSVIVTASQENHEKIDELIAGLDDEKHATGARDQYVLRLTHAGSEEVARQLTQVFRNTRRGKRSDPGPSFIADLKTNAIVASLNEKEHDGVMELLALLDVKPEEAAKRTTEVYPVKYSDPGSINAVILNQFRWDRRTQGSPSEKVTSAIDWGTRSVVVTASSANHEIIARMIEQVDVESTTVKEMYTRKLEHASAEDLARSLQQVYRGRRRTGRGEQPVQITADVPTNSLLILANAEEMAELEELIVLLDVKPELAKQRQMKSIKLIYAHPAYVQDAINQLFRRSSRNPRDQVTAVPEYGSNSVIVSASPENMERVDELVAQMDASNTNLRQVKVVNIENAEPSSVARALNDIFIRSAQRSRGGEQPISISEIQGSKSILVKANETDMGRIMQTVTELDKEAFDIGEAIRIVPLLKSDATEMLEVMQEYLRKPGGSRGRRGGGGDLSGDVRLSVLAQANSLVVSGQEEEVERIEGIIKQIDDTSEGKTPTLITLEYAEAGLILPTLEQMFSETSRRGGRRGSTQQPPVIVANEALNALIVRAGSADLAAIKSMVATLDSPDAEQPELLRIVQVAPGINVTDLALKLEDQFNEAARARSGGGSSRGRRSGRQTESISITADTRTHSLLVSGSPTLAKQVEETVRQLEKLGPPGGKALRILRPTNLTAQEVQQLIDQMKEDGSSSSGSRKSSRGSSGRRRR